MMAAFWGVAPGMALASNPSTTAGPNGDYLRVNQIGYLPSDTKVAIAFSNTSLSSLSFCVINYSGGATLWGPTAFPAAYSGGYAPFTDVYQLNFSSYQPSSPVTCYLQLSDGTQSVTFGVSSCVYQGTVATAVNFYRGQNCGTGNWYGGTAAGGSPTQANCHMAPGTSGWTTDEDGSVVDGPNKGATLDVEGGIHDSGDWIKFMITTAWVDEGLLYSYQANPSVFQDLYGPNLQPGGNGVPDVLDEGRYILNWIIQMNPNATTFYYDVADGRDHNNFGNLAKDDVQSYTGGNNQGNGAAYPNAASPYRAVYGGTNDQGGSNNAARAAGALAMGYQIWNASGTSFQDTAFAATCLTHAQWLYALAKAENYTQVDVDNFYPENNYTNYADMPEMEMAAVQLYKATGTAGYLTDAQSFAANVGSAGGQLDWNANNFMAQLCLYKASPSAAVSGYMKADLEADLARFNASGNPYGVDYPYGWGGMEDQTSSVFMCQEWKKLFPSDTTFDAMGTANRDWLLGRNPWGVCFIQGMGTVYPLHPQHNIAMAIYPTIINGGAIEGPCDYASYSSQGSILTGGQDQYAAFDNNAAGGWVYHDDNGDYTSNEITSTTSMWNLSVLANLAGQCSVVSATSTPTNTSTASPTKTRTATPSATASQTPTNTPTQTGTSTATPSQTSTASPSPTATNSATPTATALPIDFSNWELQEPNGNTISPTQLESGYSDAYFYRAADGGQAFMDPQTGTPTSGSLHPRSELREMNGGSPAAWAPTGTNSLTVSGAVNQVGGGSGGHVTLAQVFDGTGGFPLCEFEYSNSLGGFEILYEEASGSGTYINLGVPISLNTPYSFSLSLTNDVLTVTVNGTAVYTHTIGAAVQGDQFYFKVGDYDQTATSGTVTTTPYTVVEDDSISVVHSTASPTATPTNSSTSTASPTDSTTATPTSSPTLTATPPPTATGTATSTSTSSATASPTSSKTPTATSTPSSTSTVTPLNTATATPTSTVTDTPQFSFTPTSTPVNTASFTATSTASRTATMTPTSTSTQTFTPSWTSSSTASRTPTASSTPSFTPSATATMTSSFTLSPTPSVTSTVTLTPSSTPNSPLLTPNPTPVVYPNPSTGSGPIHLLVDLPQGGEVKVKLFTTAFRKVWQEDFSNEPAGEDRLTLEVPSLANGVYYLVVEADGKRWMVKMMILG